MQGMLSRFITEYVKEEIKFTPAVALIGARQVGKTTLANKIASQTSSIYIDLESPADLAKLTDKESFFKENSDKLIVIDEIHRSPDLFMVLRGVIDAKRIAGEEGNQFLLLGSASMDLLRQPSESLAGRISYVNISGINLLEINKENIKSLWLRGGFPNVYLANTNKLAMSRLENLIRTYLERDIPQMGFNVPAVRLRRLWTMLAHLQGENINYTSLASNLEVDRKTINFYLDILVDLLLVRRLEPWYANVKKGW